MSTHVLRAQLHSVLATQAVREHEQLRMKLGLGSSNSSGPRCGVEEGRWV